MLAVLGWIAFGLLLAIAVPAQVIGLPGTWIIFVDVLALRVLAGADTIGTMPVFVAGLMAAGGEVLEFYVSASGARTDVSVKGTTAAAIAGAIGGGILGAPFFFGIGAIFGAALGAFTLVFLLSLAGGLGLKGAGRSGSAALTGRLRGTAAKLLLAVAMIVFVVSAVIFW